MIVELGHYALVLALALSIVQAIVPIWGAVYNDERMMATASYTSPMIFLLIFLSFLALVTAYVTSDFSVMNVWQNSHSQMPTIFQISGTWGNHEGSMLLWVLILALFAALVALFGGNLPPSLKANVLGVQAWVLVAFLLFVLFTSNPFIRVDQVPFEGRDLNPILQDVGLAIHPPLLYLGYVGYSITFSFAVAALIEGRIDAAWARWVRPWALLAWSMLTAGIAVGSYWAYYELGWGGWWFWDPVENSSFMPWLSGTALLHSALVMEKRSALKVWTVLLAILTFSLSLLGTFLVRSGVLTSVHTFASDPQRGVFILTILALFIGGSLALFALRVGKLQTGGIFAPISREGALVLNNLILSTATATVLVGTLYPMVLEALTGNKISVGAPFFNYTFGPLMIPLLIAVPFGPLLAWKRGDIYAASQRLFVVFGATLLVTIIAFGYLYGGPVLAPLGVGLAVWLMLGSLAELQLRSGFFKNSFSVAMHRMRGLPRTVWGTAMAHFGLGMTVLGIVAVTAYESENIVIMKPGSTAHLSGYTLRLDKITPRNGPNFSETVARISVIRDNKVIDVLKPTKRLYTARKMPTSESAIKTFVFTQLYLALGEVRDDGSIVVRIWWKPLITLIWLGSMVMFFGGMLSLSDRRLRVGAPKPAANRSRTANADA